MAAAVSDTPTLLTAMETTADITASTAAVAAGVGAADKMPQIRLTPTFKLLAVPKIRTADNKRKFVCPYVNCGKSYGKSSHLRSHLTWHSGIKPFVCQEPNCGKGFTRSDELNRHIRTHTGEKPFECIQCFKKFSRSDHLTKHLATHAKQMANAKQNEVKFNKNTATNRVQQLAAASNRFQSSNANTQQLQQSVEQQLEIKRETPTPPLHFSDGMHFMAALIRQSPTAVALESSIVKEEMPEMQESKDALTNGSCDNSSSALKIKLERNDHGSDYQVVQLTTASATASKAAKAFVQQLQLKTETTHNALNGEHNHELSVPDDTGLILPNAPAIKFEPSDDAICPEANPTPQRYKGNAAEDSIHKRLGNGDEEFPYVCSDCSRGFKRQDCLNRHKRTHSGEKPYFCQQCDKRFTRSDHLKKHMKTHDRTR